MKVMVIVKATRNSEAGELSDFLTPEQEARLRLEVERRAADRRTP
ncbi:MAG TPA: hypothetical protein VK601_25300 [Kofleriaceae bacterium]|nr:hypothetical protein [Kofleriaceae bacterium]